MTAREAQPVGAKVRSLSQATAEASELWDGDQLNNLRTTSKSSPSLPEPQSPYTGGIGRVAKHKRPRVGEKGSDPHSPQFGLSSPPPHPPQPRPRTQLLRERGEVVDVLAGVLAAGDAEAKVEVKTFEELVAKVVPLNHAEVVDRLVSHCELHPDRQEGAALSLALKSAGKAQDRQHPSREAQ